MKGSSSPALQQIGSWRGVPLNVLRGGTLLPAGPRRAVVNGLNLVDAHTPLRAALLEVVRRASFIVPAVPLRRTLHADLAEWLIDRIDNPGEVIPGETRTLAVGRHESRVDLLLMARDGEPLGFLRLSDSAHVQRRMEHEAHVVRMLQRPQPATFRVPALRMQGCRGAWSWQFFEPLPDGPLRRPRIEPRRLAGVVDEYRDRIVDLARPLDTPLAHVPGHGDFTHRNLRVARDGTLWLIDWEYARWMPRLADELRFWAARYAFTLLQRPQHAARRIVEILRDRGSDAEIAEAVAWPEFNRPAEAAIRNAVAALLGVPPRWRR
jgi:hypothetical protein